ncbi:MAG: hypothetical protein NTZ01_03465 [Verrucomicrobia bacterium]|nr:hypothetical protein [Verrucomicrobiota bacterium]
MEDRESRILDVLFLILDFFPRSWYADAENRRQLKFKIKLKKEEKGKGVKGNKISIFANMLILGEEKSGIGKEWGSGSVFQRPAGAHT